MELNLQFGFGMMDHSSSLVDSWGGGNVILSPRDLSEKQLATLAGKLQKLRGGSVWVDPQFYLPRADHQRLCSHKFWPSSFETGIFWHGKPLDTLLQELTQLNDRLGTAAMVLPGVLANEVTDDWLLSEEAIIEAARKKRQSRPLIATIALSDDALRDVRQITELLERAESWDIDGFYIVAQHPGGDYLVTDPSWLANLIDLAAGLRLMRKSVTLGYCTHQMLIASAAKVTAICSGTWMNVRSFPPEKFVIPEEDSIKQRTKWYYCPQALSEYKVPFLDIAQRQGLLQDMASPKSMKSKYADLLFSGAQPTTVTAFSEQNAFRHYLHCLRSQAHSAVKTTFAETVKAQEASLDEAEALLSRLRKAGVYGQLRDFSESVDASRSALQVLVSLRGAKLEREWSSL